MLIKWSQVFAMLRHDFYAANEPALQLTAHFDGKNLVIESACDSFTINNRGEVTYDAIDTGSPLVVGSPVVLYDRQ